MSEKIEKERCEPPEPSAVIVGGVRIEAVPWGKVRGLGQNGGYVAACDLADGHELWLLKVYDVSYDDAIEEDKQDCFIDDMSLDIEGRLRISDARSRLHLVDVERRALVQG